MRMELIVTFASVAKAGEVWDWNWVQKRWIRLCDVRQ